MLVTIKKDIPAGQENQTKEIIWFDSFYKKMLKFQCDNLKYNRVEEKYIEKEGKNIPLETAVEEIVKKENIPKLSFAEKNKWAEKYIKENIGIKTAYRIKAIPETHKRKPIKKKKSIKELFNEYLNYNHSTAELIEENNKGTVFEVEPKEIEDFCYFFERNNIRYEI